MIVMYILSHETTIKECMRMVDGIFANIFNPWSVRFPFANHLRPAWKLASETLFGLTVGEGS